MLCDAGLHSLQPLGLCLESLNQDGGLDWQSGFRCRLPLRHAAGGSSSSWGTGPGLASVCGCSTTCVGQRQKLSLLTWTG